MQANHVRYGVESLPTFEQQLGILKSAAKTFTRTHPQQDLSQEIGIMIEA